MKRIDKYIECEKNEQHSPFLHSRIMAKIEAHNTAPAAKTGLWQSAIVAVSVLAVVALGITVGGITNNTQSYDSEQTMIINDDQIENLATITAHEEF